jgi:hypothetical protein
MLLKVLIRFAALVALYLLFAGQISQDECVAGCLSAAILTTLSMRAGRMQRTRFRFKPTVVAGQVLTAMPNLLTDSLKLAACRS